MILAALMFSGCASTGKVAKNDGQSDNPLAIRPLKTGSFTSSGRYVLSADEKAQDCKRIRGKMGVRIVQLQRTGIVRDSSTLSRKFGGFFGSSGQTLDAATTRKHDRAVLVAYNRLLASKNCPTFDLDKELAPRPPEPAQVKTSIRPQTR